MGHLHIHLLKHVKTLDSAEVGTLESICQICPKAKHARNPFHSSTSRTNQTFDLIHVDTWGPYKDSTYNDYKFFLTVVDDFSRMTWVFLMKHKSEAITILEKFAIHIHTEFGKVIKVMRSDNAAELCGKKAQAYIRNI